jgi:multimeric flavodoxin WrbA
MKVISIIGSPHGMKGNTAPIVNKILESAQNAGAQTEIFLLSELLVNPCKGCEVCCKTGKCVIDDDFITIKNAMLDADGIILASPNHMYNISAQMKALLDRCYSACHCQMLKGKYGAAVVTSGGPNAGMGEEYLLYVLEKLGLWTAGSICAVIGQLVDEDERSKIMESAASLGRRMVKAIKEKEIFQDQENEINEFFEMVRAMITMQKDIWPFEYEYWKSHWGVEE